MAVTDQQVRKLFMEHQKTGHIGASAMKAGMNRKTAAGYIKRGRLPSEANRERFWRTKQDPFKGCWAEVEKKLQEAPELEAKALFEWLCEQHPGLFQEGQLRTLQRRVLNWRITRGPDKEIFFPQEHTPGKRLSTDFTCMNDLGITVSGRPFLHLLCHSVLTYSNWEWAVICHSESLLSLRKGLQATLLQLGHVPIEHWTDHSTGATHALSTDANAHRGFNERYLELMRHFQITPRTIQVKKPHENGDVESSHGVLKRRIRQHLLLRGSVDFSTTDDYRIFLEDILHKGNRLRRQRFGEEIVAMKPLDVDPMPDYIPEQVRVSKWSMILIDRKTYSVPSRLIGHSVRVHRYEDLIEVYVGGVLQLSMPRLHGETTHAVNYRHVIEWLLRKPGAFAEYRFREDLFPSLAFRRAYDRLSSECPRRVADHDYLRILRQAARTQESIVETILLDLETQGLAPRWNLVMEFWPQEHHEHPILQPLTPDLTGYDTLFEQSGDGQ